MAGVRLAAGGSLSRVCTSVRRVIMTTMVVTHGHRSWVSRASCRRALSTSDQVQAMAASYGFVICPSRARSDWLLHAGAVSLAVSCAACTPINHKPIETGPRDSGHSTAHRMTDSSVEAEARPLLLEQVRVITGNTSDDSTRAETWRFAWYNRAVPIPQIAPVTTRLLTEAYAHVPPFLLTSVRWQDSVPTYSSPDDGIAINRPRAARLAWETDSVALSNHNPDAAYARIFERPPSDYVLTMLMAHELAHLAIDFTTPRVDQPEAVVECAADVIGAFQVASVAPRLSPNGALALHFANVSANVAGDVLPGDWISANSHPDREQRAACMMRGFELYDAVREHAPITSQSFLTSSSDSLLEHVVLGEVSLTSAAIWEARLVLSLPGSRPPRKATSSAYAFESDPDASRLVTFLLAVLDSMRAPDGIASVIGVPLTSGTALFPADPLNEVTLPIAPPWKCALVTGTSERAPTVACYAIGDMTHTEMVGFLARAALLSAIKKRGLFAQPLGAAVTRGAQLASQQWLLSGAERGRVILSMYSEPYPINRQEWNSQQVTWYSLAWLPNRQ